MGLIYVTPAKYFVKLMSIMFAVTISYEGKKGIKFHETIIEKIFQDGPKGCEDCPCDTTTSGKRLSSHNAVGRMSSQGDLIGGAERNPVVAIKRDHTNNRKASWKRIFKTADEAISISFINMRFTRW